MLAKREKSVQNKARAFAPAGISSFFEICDTAENGKPILDATRIGARGGGFVIEKGVTTDVEVFPEKRNLIEVFINKKSAPEAETTKTAAQMILEKTRETFHVKVRHKVDVPIGAGFGSSAAGALGTALALTKALGLKCTYNELGRVAHVAEVKCRTGLGTVGPLMLGGCILTREPGAPGLALIDRIPMLPHYVVVAVVFEGIPTKTVLASPEKRLAVNKNGRRTLEKILSEPSIENFFVCCLEFAEETGFMTQRLRELVKLAQKAGVLGVAQNMVGEAVHTLTTLNEVESVVKAFERVLPHARVLTARIDFQGAKLLF